jgi:protein TonB
VSLLQAWLARHREYPNTARIRRQQGTTLLRFVMDRQGRILSHRIEHSSGIPALDRAVEEMLARAEPLPAIPPEVRSAQLELIVPIRFELR